MSQKAKFGFTLIELLVVISIIGILATLILANIAGVRSRARDARRKSDIRTIQNAIQMYYNDKKTYPCGSLPGNPSPCLGCNCTDISVGGGCPIPSDDVGRWKLLRDLLEPNYIYKLPTDPLPRDDVGRTHQYTYGCKIVSGNTEYELEAIMENKSDNDAINDYGSSTFLYEKGTNLNLNPRSWLVPWPPTGY